MASWPILAVVILHYLLKKVPRWLSCVLWVIVAIRLICPFSFESTLSLMPSGEVISPDILYAQEPTIHSGIEVLNSTVNPMLIHSFSPEPVASVNPLQVWTLIASYIWLMGIATLLIYAIFSFLRLRKKVRVSLNIRDNLWICDDIQTSFILGIIKPRIYLPSTLNEIQQTHVIAHEVAHLKRRDYWWKPLGYLLLIIYWFNPLCWLGYILFCRDIELASDEKVISKMGKEDRIAYSETLLSCSISNRMIMACPLAFGEVRVKERIKAVLNYKKPIFWIIIAAITVYVLAAVSFLTNPVKNPITPKNNQTKPIQLKINPESERDSVTVTKWFDYLHDSPMPWEGSLETEISDYPGITFRWTPYGMISIHKGKETELFTGMPIWNAFFRDLTGDGKPEICSTISVGFGMIDNRIIVFDYAKGVSYELSKRGEFDYSLFLQDGNLMVNKHRYNSDELLEVGHLANINGDIEMVKDESSSSNKLIRTYVFRDIETLHTESASLYDLSNSGEEPSVDHLHIATISLYDNGEFLFSFSPISSYIGHGQYTMSDNRLTLKTEDGSYTYVFDMVDDHLVFDAEASSDKVWGSGITSGIIFKLMQTETIE